LDDPDFQALRVVRTGESAMRRASDREVRNGVGAGLDDSVPRVGPEATARLSENPTLVARLRRRLIDSLPGLIALAVPPGIAVACGACGFRLAFGQFSDWVHGAGRATMQPRTYWVSRQGSGWNLPQINGQGFFA
jgi:hypothetical protein